MNKHTFLIEVGTEELPSKNLRILGENFAKNIINELLKNKIKHGKVKWFASSRRLAVKIFFINDTQLDSYIEIKGPSISKSFDDKGNTTIEAKSWAKKIGIKIHEANKLITNKGSWLIFKKNIKGKSLKLIICKIINKALSNLKLSKMMNWKNNKVIRPIHTITILIDNFLILGNVLGIKVDRILLGHRFMKFKKIYLKHANDYPKILIEQGKVIADFNKRKKKILISLKEEANKIGGIIDIKEDLLDEVTSLVEWPIVLTAKFDKKFLNIPNEALIYTMIYNQKYFPVYSNLGLLLPYFIFVTNIETKNFENIIIGNERIIKARLADAEYFYNMDCKIKLEDRLPFLKKVLFHQKLGSLFNKSYRLKSLTKWIAKKIGANINDASRAGIISKCDLVTNMVSEYTDIKGIMGMYYAINDGENNVVALAIKEQYYPRFYEDVLPTTKISSALAIADKIDNLTGILGINKFPKGDKDPFALRRAAIGIIRIIIKNKLNLNLHKLIKKSVILYNKYLINKNVVNDVVNYIFNRIISLYKKDNYNINIVQSVLVCNPKYITDFDARIKAIIYFINLNKIKELILTNKRLINILVKNNKLILNNLNYNILNHPIEIKLINYLFFLKKKLKPFFEKYEYKKIIIEMINLIKFIDIFFENVKIMVDDTEIKKNRLTIIKKLRNFFLKIADFSLL